jgi:predicted Fe-Mo cluster-binding NifX family protein/ferredoxin
MKIAVTSTGPTLDDSVEARFGRCAYFLIIDTETLQYEPMDNPNIALGGGAGIQSAQLMSEKGVTAVLTGNCGPNAFNVFGQAGIQVIVGVSGPVHDAVEQFKAAAFTSASGPSVSSHFGMNTSMANPAPKGQSMTGSTRQGGGMGFGIGGGRGMVRGMGGGRGMGKGMGRGGGMGRGLGRGMGRGMGMGMGGGFGMNPWPTGQQPAPPPVSESDPNQTKAFLHEQVQSLEQQKRLIEQRIEELETGRRSIAVVDSEKCTGCGICINACPVGAIEVKERAAINEYLCTGCAACVNECPNDAITMARKE